nr:hypothetical protein [Tanacetum cinerariifolium]
MCWKPYAKYSFTPDNRLKFCQFIKGVKLPNGFGSNFKQKVTDNDSNIIGMKSHDCHIMMQHLLPYGLQKYLDLNVAKLIIEFCLFFKQICAQTLMEDDMAKAESQLIDILCNLEQIYPPAFFDIMIHLVIHLLEEDLEGGPIPYWWMYPFERYMKKLRNYVQNKSKPKGSIAKGYVAEEALTFCSHYFQGVTTKFNRLDFNVDCPPPICQFYVFRSMCRMIGKWSVIRLDHQEMKKVICMNIFMEFPSKYMKQEFPGWFEPQGGDKDGGSKGVCKETRNLRLKKCMDEYGSLKIGFEYNNKETMLHVGQNSTRWSNLVVELARDFPMYYLSWHSIEKSKRAHIMGRLMEEMLRLRDSGANTLSGVPYTEEEILALSEIGGGSGSRSGEGGDDKPGGDEDADGDDDI